MSEIWSRDYNLAKLLRKRQENEKKIDKKKKKIGRVSP